MNQYHDTLVQLNKYPAERYNVLIPVTSMQVMSNMQRIIVNEVQLNTEDDGGDIYYEKSSGKYAITKVGGMKLAAAANISVVSSESKKPDVCIKCVEMAKAVNKAHPCGSCPHAYDVKFEVTIRVPEPSGGFRLIPKHKEIDCAAEKESMRPDQFKRFLPHRASIAESKALMRCIRDALGLQAGYALEELKKPFIIAHVVPNLDAPEIRQALASNYLQSMGMLFEMPAGPSGQKALEANVNGALGSPEAPLPPGSGEPFDESEYPDDDTPPFDMPDGIFCDSCGKEIVESQGRNGKTWSPEAIKGYSEKTFSRCLCPACQQVARKEGY